MVADSSSPARWGDGLIALVVDLLDRGLRRHYCIREFSDDANCLLRIAWTTAAEPVRLRDGTLVQVGDTVGEIHLWNEHLPRFRSDGPSLGWARQMHRQMTHSLDLLASHLEQSATRRPVVALYADVALPKGRSPVMIGRVALRHGFELIPQPRTPLRSLHEVAGSLLLWGLASVHNPAVIRRQKFFRQRQRIWIGRATLVARYGHHAAQRDRAEPITVPALT
jgi:YkoP domain